MAAHHHHRPPARPRLTRSFRPWWRWMLTALAFPSGLIAHLIAGPVDDVPAAVIGGAIAGVGIGAAQWALLRHRGIKVSWIPASAAGLAAGLAVGSAVVDYRTDITSLAVMGFFSGLGMGLAQGVTLGNARALPWAGATAALWALGWVITTAGGIDVDEQWVTSGSTAASPSPSCRARSSARSFPPRRRSHDRRLARRIRHGPCGPRLPLPLRSSPRALRFAWSTAAAPRRSPASKRSAATPPTPSSPARSRPTPAPCTSASTRPDYHRWAEEFPRPCSARSVDVANAADAKLVVLENLYMYGPTAGPLGENTPVKPTSTKSRIRAAMLRRTARRASRGEVRVVIGRASDFVGPGVRAPPSASSCSARPGRQASPDDGTTRHSAHLQLRPRRRSQSRAAGARADDVYGRVPGISRTRRPAPRARSSSTCTPRPGSAAPTSPPSSDRCCAWSGCSTATSVSSCTPTTSSMRRSSLTTLAFRDAFGGHTTSWDDIVASTVDWYRATRRPIVPPAPPRPRPRR